MFKKVDKLLEILMLNRFKLVLIVIYFFYKLDILWRYYLFIFFVGIF